jgi:hypothetical protein
MMKEEVKENYFTIDPTTLINILKSGFLRKSTKNPTVEPLALDFRDDGLYIVQLDSTNTMFLLHYYPKSVFSAYKVSGLKKIKSDILDYLGKSFKIDSTINVSFTENDIVVEGKRERLRQALSALETKPDKPVELKKTEVGFLTSKLAVRSAYLVDVSELSSVLDSDEVRFEYDGSGITATVESSDKTVEYNKKIVPIRTKGSESGKVVISSELLSRVLDVLSGQVWLAFTEEPIVVSHIEGEKILTYILATRVGV